MMTMTTLKTDELCNCINGEHKNYAIKVRNILFL